MSWCLPKPQTTFQHDIHGYQCLGQFDPTPRGFPLASSGGNFPKEQMVADCVTTPLDTNTLREPEKRWTPVSAFNPVACNARSQAKAEALFAAECGKRLRILNKWCAALDLHHRWSFHLHLLQACESVRTRPPTWSAEEQEFEERHRSRLRHLEQKYSRHEAIQPQQPAVFSSMTIESGDIPSHDMPAVSDNLIYPDAMLEAVSGAIKPTPTVQCSEDIALTPGSGTIQVHDISGPMKTPPTVQCSEDIALIPGSGTNASQDNTPNSGNLTGAHILLVKNARHALFQSENKWNQRQSDLGRSMPTVKLKLRQCAVQVPESTVKLKTWKCGSALARPHVKLKLLQCDLGSGV